MTAEWARRSVRDFWAREERGGGARLLDAALAPAEAAFRMAVGLRNARHERRRRAPAPMPMPVVAVGNLTVGGTGKTPVVRWIGDWLRGEGARAAVVTRGYGADETALYAGWFGRGAVFAGRDRAAGVGAARDAGFDVALVDDGFQHRGLARDVDVLLVAADDPLAARLLPRGPYREPVRSARRATHILVTRRSRRDADAAAAWLERLRRAAPGVPVATLDLSMRGWRNLHGAAASPPRGDVLAVCSIARPRAFRRGLAELLPNARIEVAAFADHHAYTRRDAARLAKRLRGRSLVCTAKDAVKLRRFPELASCCTVVGLRIDAEPQGDLRRALRRAARGRCASR